MRVTGLALVAAAAAGMAQAGDYHAPRTSWGAPDLEGIWDQGSYTKLQRPKDFTALVITPEQARAYEAKLAAHHGVPAGGADLIGQLDSEFPDAGHGLTRIRGEIRSSGIVDPPDGRIPYREDVKKRLHIGPFPPGGFDNPEERPSTERCVASGGSAAPLLASNDANLLQIVQTNGEVAILAEKDHELRIVRLRRTRDPRAPPTWAGNSIGHWEGGTLVVETEGFRDPIIERWPMLYQSRDAKVVERFTRVSPTEVLYAFSITDPAMFTQTWRAETVFKSAKGPLYEYACHEGNYSIVNDLQGARVAEAAAKDAPAAKAGQ